MKAVLSRIGFCLAVSFLMQDSAHPQSFPLWGSLKPGTYPVGFRTSYKYDYSRVYKSTVNLSGKQRTGDRARPIQISVWYPAATPPGGPRVRFGTYVELLETEEEKRDVTDSLRRIATDDFRGAIRRWLGEDPSVDASINLLAMETNAVKDANPAPGRHPVVIFAQGSSQSVFMHAVLCEYLASNGIVVATSPSFGPNGREMTDDLRGVEAQARDLEFIIAFLREGPVADLGKLGIAGFSFGGNAALLEAMRNPDVKGVLSMDSNLGFEGDLEFLRQDSDFLPERMGVPLLHFSQKDVPGLNNRLLDTLIYSDVAVVHAHGLTHFDFSSLGMITAMVPRFVTTTRPNQRVGYESLCELALTFFRASLAGDSDSRTFMQGPVTSGRGAGILSFNLKQGVARPPTHEEVVDLIKTEGIVAGGKVFRTEMQRLPSAALFREASINRLGYEFLYAYRMIKEAIEIFRWNVQRYPASFNVYDSLGEAYLIDGQTNLAITNYRKSLELNPANTNATEILKRIDADRK